MSTAKGKQREKPIASLVAGATAGGIESFITYPLESLKTQVQFGSLNGSKKTTPYQALKTTLEQRGVRGLYAGCSAVVIGNAVKAGVRFTSYDQFKSLLKDDEGKLTAPRSMLAGLGAGLTEAIIAVTPSETIKTKMIEDSKLAQPRFKGLIHGTGLIIKEEGYLGIYRGLGPVVSLVCASSSLPRCLCRVVSPPHTHATAICLITLISLPVISLSRKLAPSYSSALFPALFTDLYQMLRQGANSAVRFSSYSTLKQLAQGNIVGGAQVPGWMTFGIGACAGVITVYCTMPFDVIKTRMQSLTAKTQYRNSLHCAYRIMTEEGILKFWNGTTPRLGRLIMSGGIIFTVYEQVYPLVASVAP
ncbi:hypothetical protein P7C73_g5027, partial [Tremellales sp. Uapishka_1]